MSTPTKFLTQEVHDFLTPSILRQGYALTKEHSALLMTFLESCRTSDPGLAEELYKFCYACTPSLRERYTDYTLSVIRPGTVEEEPVESYPRYYNTRITSNLLDKDSMKECMKAVGMLYAMAGYPDLADYVYKHIYDTHPQLNQKYTDYCLVQLRSGAADPDPILSRQDYYNETFIKPANAKQKLNPAGIQEAIALGCGKYRIAPDDLDAAKGIEEDCRLPLKNYRDHWRAKLKLKGYSVLSRQDLAAYVRNTVFHLAFALKMDVTTVSTVLTKCLQMQDFNPRDHREVIYYWCLRYQIPYQKMVTDYLVYYHSPAFRDQYANRGIADIRRLKTEYLLDYLNRMCKPEDPNVPVLMEYLWRVRSYETYLRSSKPQDPNPREKKSQHAAPKNKALLRTTPRKVFRDHFLDFPVSVHVISSFANGLPDIPEDAPLEDTLDAYVRRTRGLAPDDGKEVLKPTLEERILYRIRNLERLRKLCHAVNEEPLLPDAFLIPLFEGLEYTEATVFDRIYGSVPITRNELVATMFIGFFSDIRYEDKHDPYGKEELLDYEDDISLNLVDCGMRKLYYRNPFELFTLLCFQSRDPLCYFLSSWEQAIRASAEK